MKFQIARLSEGVGWAVSFTDGPLAHTVSIGGSEQDARSFAGWAMGEYPGVQGLPDAQSFFRDFFNGCAWRWIR
jgi:hypothetical protein